MDEAGEAMPCHDMPRHGLDKAPHDMGLTRHAKIWIDMPQYGQKACHNKGLTCLDTGSTCLDTGSTCLDTGSTCLDMGLTRHPTTWA